MRRHLLPKVSDDGNGGSRIIVPGMKPRGTRITLTSATIVVIAIAVSGWTYKFIEAKTKTETRQEEILLKVDDHEGRIRTVEDCTHRVEANVEIIKENVDKLIDIAMKKDQ